MKANRVCTAGLDVKYRSMSNQFAKIPAVGFHFFLVIWNFQTKPEILTERLFKKYPMEKNKISIFLNIDIFQIVHRVLEPENKV